MRTIYPHTQKRSTKKNRLSNKHSLSVGIYLDNAASTPIDARVLKAMNLAYKKYGNPSSFNNSGREARKELESARLVIARFVGAKPKEIVFTSSASEANNLALVGILGDKGKGLPAGRQGTVLTTATEHPSVLEPLKNLKNINLKFIPINKEGVVDLEKFKKMLTSDCRLVSVMYANNEIGTIQPIRQMSKIIRDFNQKLEIGNWKLKIDGTKKVLFHIDACQATGFLDMNINHLGADLLTFNGSKIYGPRGIGVLYVRHGINLQRFILGGSQEHGFRAGTENMPAIVGLAKAISLINEHGTMSTIKLRDYAIKKLEEISGVILNGSRGADRLANNISICIPNLESENLLLELDKYGISAGSGSACTSHAVEPSHVLKAIGVSSEYINGAIRFSLGRSTTKKDIDYLVKTLVKIIVILNKRYPRLK